MNSIGERVRKLREVRDISQNELGDAIGVRQTTISEIERGGNQPSVLVLRKLAEYFGVKPGFFLDDEPVKFMTEVEA